MEESYRVENTVRKGEIARHKQFLLFPQCFQKACFPGTSKGVIVWEWVKKSLNLLFERLSLKSWWDKLTSVYQIAWTKIRLHRIRDVIQKSTGWLPCEICLVLTPYQTTYFRLFQTERVCRQQFQIWRKWQKAIQQVENTAGKWEIAHNCNFPSV